MGLQSDYFAQRGGDDYFERNQVGQELPYRDEPAVALARRFLAGGPASVAVIGGAGGREAAALAEAFPDWSFTNVDISRRAIDFGQRAYPHVRHEHASIAAEDLVARIGRHRCILLAGILSWVDREELSLAITNVDRALEPGGLLLISDFLPRRPRRTQLKHQPGAFTYKQDYSLPFVALGTYRRLTVEHHVQPLAKPPADRYPRADRIWGVQVLRKMTWSESDRDSRGPASYRRGQSDAVNEIAWRAPQESLWPAALAKSVGSRPHPRGRN